MWGLALIPPSLPLGPNLRLVAACTFAITGVGFLCAGFVAFSRARTTIDPVNIDRASALVTSGVYRVSRNPMYVGFTAILLGWSIFLTGAWALAGPVAFVWCITRLQIIPEERAMLKRFGGKYAEYRLSTRRWL